MPLTFLRVHRIFGTPSSGFAVTNGFTKPATSRVSESLLNSILQKFPSGEIRAYCYVYEQ